MPEIQIDSIVFFQISVTLIKSSEADNNDFERHG